MIELMRSFCDAIGDTERLLGQAWTSIQQLATQHPATAIACGMAAGFALLVYRLTRDTLRWKR